MCFVDCRHVKHVAVCVTCDSCAKHRSFSERHEATDRSNGGAVLCEVRNIILHENQPSKN